jgi:hypothetical protein
MTLLSMTPFFDLPNTYGEDTDNGEKVSGNYN